ncbi:MAG: ferritin family protein [Candidatus Aminicenantes bacterium]|nr:ferritin family protein [Candidatus Aminicenantes bacterium]
MSFVFNADEIFAMALKIEENGEKFYRDSAARIADPEAIQLLLKLADMEVDHQRIFTGMQRALSPADRKAMTFDPNNEAGLYLASLANAKVFFEKDIDTSNLEGIFRAALAAEKDSIAFYLGMKDLVPAGRGREKIEEIIREEMRHVRVLGERLTTLKK